ncbi:MAG: glucuronate isomerase, partial [Bacteroidota bacterium]
RTPDFSTRRLLKKMKVELVCTTDDPIDSLEHHQSIRKDSFSINILPTFRPDKAYAIENPSVYKNYLQKLSGIVGMDITSFEKLMEALAKRIDFFHSMGCRLSDHGLERICYPIEKPNFTASALFKKIINEETLSHSEQEYFKYAVLIELCRLYHKHGWTQQFHLGALRNTNDRMLRSLGPDTGFDSIGDFDQGRSLARFLNELDSTNQLSKTILYNLNPRDNEVMATMTGNFNDGSSKGKIQFGAAWWFLDQKDGMEKQLNTLSSLGLLSCFIGMLTDSRSFLSYPRHEYFRRILCNLIAKDVANGELPWDENWLGKIVADVCYYNAKGYFSF